MANLKLNHTLLILLRYPEPGKVKTRLSQDIGIDKAAEIYSCMAETVVHNLAKSDLHKTIIFFDPPERKAEVENWLKVKCKLFPQKGKSLGERMTNAFDKTFSLGAEKAVIIGTDCIEISDEIISQAFNALDLVDVVIGPAEDGGYYLLGMAKPTPKIFDDIDWSTDSVLGQTLKKLREKELQFELLKTLRDVDTVSDLNGDLLLRLQENRSKNLINTNLLLSRRMIRSGQS